MAKKLAKKKAPSKKAPSKKKSASANKKKKLLATLDSRIEEDSRAADGPTKLEAGTYIVRLRSARITVGKEDRLNFEFACVVAAPSSHKGTQVTKLHFDFTNPTPFSNGGNRLQMLMQSLHKLGYAETPKTGEDLETICEELTAEKPYILFESKWREGSDWPDYSFEDVYESERQALNAAKKLG